MGLLALILKTMDHLGWSVPEQTAVQILRQAGGWPAQVFMAGVTVVLAPVAEEILFRGILTRRSSRPAFRALALWGTSLLFAAVHFNAGHLRAAGSCWRWC